MNRAYSLLTVKSVSEDERIIRGVATTPTPDRVGDVVEPLGVKFNNPLPLLHQHDHTKPVGTVTFDKPTKDGITFEAKLANVQEPGPLKDRIDTAWGEVKAGLVRAVSIGFRALEDGVELMRNGGYRFKATEVLELSLVTVPANADATITLVKSIDRTIRAASGHEDVRDDEPAASGDKRNYVVSMRKKMTSKRKSLADQIAAMKNTIEEKAARMEEIQQSAIDDGRTKDASEREEFETLSDEIKALNKELDDLREMERIQMRRAKAVEPEPMAEPASDIRPAGVVHARAKAPKLDAGIEFARLARVKGLAFMTQGNPVDIARGLYGEDSSTVQIVKATVSPGTTVSGNWASALVGEESSAFADFVEWLRPQTVVGRFGSDGIPALRRVPFNVPLISQTGGGAGYWVGEAKPKPLTAFNFSRTTLTPLKVANIAVLSEENIRYSSPSSDTIIRDELGRALIEAIDAAFIDPANSGQSGVKPASITNGANTVAAQSTGDIDDIILDVRALIKKFTDANNSPRSGVIIMSEDNAVALSLMLNPLGQPAFPGMGMMGGRLLGWPVIVSSQAGTNVVLVNASDIYLGDEGGVTVDVSREASVEMLDGSLTQDPPTGASLVSLWQNNLAGFRAERTINWGTRRQASVAVLTGAAWGGAVPSS